jgi:hypothetical protein
MQFTKKEIEAATISLNQDLEIYKRLALTKFEEKDREYYRVQAEKCEKRLKEIREA